MTQSKGAAPLWRSPPLAWRRAAVSCELEGHTASAAALYIRICKKIERHGSLTMASLFMLPQEKIDYVTDRLFLTLGKLIPSVYQMLLFSGEVRVLPFLKELSKRNSQSIAKQREC